MLYIVRKKFSLRRVKYYTYISDINNTYWKYLTDMIIDWVNGNGNGNIENGIIFQYLRVIRWYVIHLSGMIIKFILNTESSSREMSN